MYVREALKLIVKRSVTHEIKIEGQTPGEWVYPGDFNFLVNTRPYVEIFNKEVKGVVAADAVLLKALE